MEELVDRKRIAVEHPRAAQVAPNRPQAHAIRRAIESVVHAVQERVEGEDVEERNEVIFGNGRGLRRRRVWRSCEGLLARSGPGKRKQDTPQDQRADAPHEPITISTKPPHRAEHFTSTLWVSLASSAVRGCAFGHSRTGQTIAATLHSDAPSSEVCNSDQGIATGFRYIPTERGVRLVNQPRSRNGDRT